jgi:hypothetical protein
VRRVVAREAALQISPSSRAEPQDLVVCCGAPPPEQMHEQLFTTEYPFALYKPMWRREKRGGECPLGSSLLTDTTCTIERYSEICNHDRARRGDKRFYPESWGGGDIHPHREPKPSEAPGRGRPTPIERCCA